MSFAHFLFAAIIAGSRSLLGLLKDSFLTQASRICLGLRPVANPSNLG